VHGVEDRNGADTKVRDLVDDYQTVDVHSFHEPFVLASQGRIIGKLVDQFDPLDIVLGSVGDGGLRSGLCLTAQALRHRAWPSLPVSQPAPWMRWSRSSRTVSFPGAARTRLPRAFARVLGSGPSRCSVGTGRGSWRWEKEEIVQAMPFASERLTLVIEPASAVAWVPLRRPAPHLVGKRVGVVRTGGHVAWWRPWPRLDRTEPLQQEGG
jgi:threonine dehydratase